ncbi:MAG TPA: inositol monophosphatase family protein [Acetobacteraceae bacterium]|jgi:fructose-1,6-bisphosphatase/inositol monophosphatase family enzyme|nr:inositol monophosphatase family protein [Acetobacteraceae bacterium]
MRFGALELATLTALLREVGQSEIMPRFRQLADGAVREKTGPLDLVTEADEAAERRLTVALERWFPSAAVVGEEATAADPGRLGLLANADLAFVVDPIDGTSNYAAGLPLFGVMAAVLLRGDVVAAAIHDPVGDDTALALRGEGAWTEASDGRRTELHVAAAVPVAAMTGNVSWRFLPEPARAMVCANLPRLGGNWDYRCAAHEYRMAAGGHCHFVFFNRLMPWDHAPGWLLHREAGGYSARLDGSAYHPTQTDGGLICTPDRASWVALRDALLTGPG